MTSHDPPASSASASPPEVIHATARRVEPSQPMMPVPDPDAAPWHGISRTRLTLAFLVAGISDLLSIATEWVPPIQWTIDFITAGVLFVLLGWRWILLPVIIAEAIPGLAIFPFWILVVTSIALTGTVRRAK
jgi:hypothetical protein